MALYVLIIVSFSFPQSDPVRALRMLFLDWTLDFKSEACCLKDKRLSNVIPRNFGFFTVGTFSPSIFISNTVPQSVGPVVNSVAVDLGRILWSIVRLKNFMYYGLLFLA